MRKTCLVCTRKHLTQAMILIMESVKEPEKYGWHRFIAFGHMAEAEDESVTNYPLLASMIREKRIDLEMGEYDNCAEWFEKTLKNVTVLIEDEEQT